MRSQINPTERPTGFLTNSSCISRQLSMQCRQCTGRHAYPLLAGRAGPAAAYPQGVCRSICSGLIEETILKRGHLRQLIVIDQVNKIEQVNQGGDHEEMDMEAFDDMTGEILSGAEVMKARKKELDYADLKKVWVPIARAEAERKGYKIISTRWIDINKGDNINPNYRSRFVGREFNDGKEDGLFAATPPLEALRLIISRTATIEKKRPHCRRVIMVNDVARAFFEAPMSRSVCVELPPEQRLPGEDKVGLLKKSLYGTRDAAANFQKLVKQVMVMAGFTVNVYNPCTFYHPGRDLMTLVHGDDFVTSGRRADVEWLKKVLNDQF